MLTHEQIMKMTMLAIDGGTVVTSDGNGQLADIVFYKPMVHKEYINLLRSSAVLYQTIESQFQALEALIAFCEELGADGLTPTLLNMQQGLNIAKRVAVEGVEAVADSLPRTGG